MTPTNIEEIFQEHADQAMRIVLSSGDHIMIPHGGAVRISGSRIVIFPDLKPGRFFTDRSIRYVSVVNVAMIEPVEPQDSPPLTN